MWGLPIQPKVRAREIPAKVIRLVVKRFARDLYSGEGPATGKIRDGGLILPNRP